MKTLHLLRHAKSSWDEPGLADHDRPLSRRGRRSAEALAAAWPGMKLAPELVLCSTALRAHATYAALAQALPETTRVQYEQALYMASATALMRRLRRVPSGVGELLVVGHNPGLEDLALLLIRHAPQELRAKLAKKLPTGACLTLELELDDWRSLGLDSARLVRFWPFSVAPRESPPDNAAETAPRPTALDIDKHTPWPSLAEAALAQSRAHAYANLAGARAGQAESIHQLRVALRRLRVTLRTFDGVLDARGTAQVRERARAMFRALGRVRELDVIDAELLADVARENPDQPGLIALRTRLAQARARHFSSVQKSLSDQTIRAFTHALDALKVDRAASSRFRPRTRAGGQLDTRLKRVLKLAGRKKKNAEQLHRLRKELKKLRYRVDIFAGLFASARVRAFADLLSRLQDRLGTLHDVMVAREALRLREGSPATPAVAETLILLEEMLGAREHEALARLPRELDRLLRARPFWR